MEAALNDARANTNKRLLDELHREMRGGYEDLKSKSKEELHGILDETALADSKKYYEDIRAVKEQQRDAFEKILDHLTKINAEFDKSDINKSAIKQDLQAIHDKISALDRVIQNIPS